MRHWRLYYPKCGPDVRIVLMQRWKNFSDVVHFGCLKRVRGITERSSPCAVDGMILSSIKNVILQRRRRSWHACYTRSPLGHTCAVVSARRDSSPDYNFSRYNGHGARSDRLRLTRSLTLTTRRKRRAGGCALNTVLGSNDGENAFESYFYFRAIHTQRRKLAWWATVERGSVSVAQKRRIRVTASARLNWLWNSSRIPPPSSTINPGRRHISTVHWSQVAGGRARRGKGKAPAKNGKLI